MLTERILTEFAYLLIYPSDELTWIQGLVTAIGANIIENFS